MSAPILHLSVSRKPVFLLNSRLSLFSVASSRWLPLSLSYGVILPSSLTTLLPSVCGFSPRLPVSVCGTGTYNSIAAFLDSVDSETSLLFLRSSSHFSFKYVFCIVSIPLCLTGYFLSPVFLSSCVPTFLIIRSTGISTCCPSITTLVLTLGPDLPWADQLYPGNLRLSTYMILTYISLLIPAFSLPFRPRSLTLTLRPYGTLLYQCRFLIRNSCQIVTKKINRASWFIFLVTIWLRVSY